MRWLQSFWGPDVAHLETLFLKLKLGRTSILTMLWFVQIRSADFDLQSFNQKFVVTKHCVRFATINSVFSSISCWSEAESWQRWVRLWTPTKQGVRRKNQEIAKLRKVELWKVIYQKTRITLYRTLILPVLLYGEEHGYCLWILNLLLVFLR